MDEGDGGFGEGGDRNEAISAVADEGFMGEEDDDYEDLYNDVNVGEGFLQSFHRTEDTGFRNQEEKRIDSAAESTGVSIPGVVGGNGGGGGEGMIEKGVSVSEPVSVAPATRLDGYQNVGFRGNDLTMKGMDSVPNSSGGGLRVSLGQPQVKMGEAEGQVVHNNSMPPPGLMQQSHGVGGVNVGNENYARPEVGGGVGAVNVGNDNYARQGGGGVGVGAVGVGAVGNMNLNGGVVGGAGAGAGGTILFVGDLHWWTTDSELEAELCKYGSVKEVRFYDEKASGKSKGYCQVEFNDSSAAAACKEGMNGHLFNGRPCVVAFASPHTVRRMGEAQVNKNQTVTQGGPLAQGRRGLGDAGGGGRGGSSIATGGNYQGDGNRSYGRGGWGRGNAQGMGRGQVGPMRNRIGGMGGRGIIGNGGNGFGQGLAATPPMMHAQTMMGQGFDPSYGAHMGRMGGYGGFPAGPTPPFSAMLSQFPPVGGVGLPGVAPHVNPAFFGRGMPGNGMGMMPTTGVEGHGMGMWADPSVAGWVNEDPGGRAGDSSYGEDAASDQQYGEVSHERAGWPNSSMKEKERAPERDWSGASDKRYRDEREPAAERDIPREKDVGHDHDWPERRQRDERETGRERERDHERERERDRDRERERDRDRYRDDRERYVDHHRYRERDLEHDNEWDRGRPSASHRSRPPHEENRRSRSRDADYAKRRRIPSE